MAFDSLSVLLVAKDSKISQSACALLAPPAFDVQAVSDFNEARRLCAERVYNIVIADYADGEGADFAIDISGSLGAVLLLAPPQLFEEVSYRVETSGVLTVNWPSDQFYFYNMIKAAIAVQYKAQILSSQTTKLKVKMEEIRLVNRAKMLLMQNLKMTEQEAHRYIEKEAMDRGLKKTAVAEGIVKTYG